MYLVLEVVGLVGGVTTLATSAYLARVGRSLPEERRHGWRAWRAWFATVLIAFAVLVVVALVRVAAG